MLQELPSLSRRAARTEERQRLFRVAGSDLVESRKRLQEDEVMNEGFVEGMKGWKRTGLWAPRKLNWSRANLPAQRMRRRRGRSAGLRGWAPSLLWARCKPVPTNLDTQAGHTRYLIP